MNELFSKAVGGLKSIPASIGQLWKSKDDLSFLNIRKEYLAFFFIIPLSYLVNYFYFLMDIGEIAGLSSKTWMMWARSVGWVICLIYPKALKGVLKISVFVTILALGLLFFLPSGQGRVVVSVIYQGSTAAIDIFSYFIFLYILNNSERVMGLITIMFLQGLYRAFDPLFQQVHRNIICVVFFVVYLFCLYLTQKPKLRELVDNVANSKSTPPKSALIASLPLLLFCIIDVFFAIRSGFIADMGIRSYYGIGILVGVVIIMVIQYFLHNSAWHTWNAFLLAVTAGMAFLIPEPVTFPIIGAFICGVAICIGNTATNYILGGVAYKYAHPIFFRLLCGIMVIYYLVGSTVADLFNRLFPAQYGYITFGVSIGFIFISVILSPVLYNKLFAAKWSDNKQKQADFDKYKLTPREKELATLLLTGMAQKNIAIEMGISYSTMKFHLNNLYRKLEVQSRVEFFALFTTPLPDDKDVSGKGLYQ